MQPAIKHPIAARVRLPQLLGSNQALWFICHAKQQLKTGVLSWPRQDAALMLARGRGATFFLKE
jgi:hypothetical protein